MQAWLDNKSKAMGESVFHCNSSVRSMKVIQLLGIDR